jgi:hypothetical protein
MSKITCEIILDYVDNDIAEMISSSVSPDNEEFIEVEIKDSKLICKAEGENPMQLLHTVDDFLACVTVAEEAIED